MGYGEEFGEVAAREEADGQRGKKAWATGVSKSRKGAAVECAR